MNKIAQRAAAKRQRVIEAASLVFRRHGFAQTSMDNIAVEAGMSRPALYLVFPNKEEIFAAAVHYMGELALAALRQGLPQRPNLEEKLLFIFEQWAGRGYDRMKENPDAKDLTDPGFQPVREVYEKLQRFLAELLADSVRHSGLRATPDQVARILVASMRGFKEVAKDSADIRRMFSLQISILLRGLEPRG
jgi:AcrR family transcriptional regulator